MPYTNVGFYKTANFNPKNMGIGYWAYLLDSTDPNHTLGLVLPDHTVRWVALAVDSTEPSNPSSSGTTTEGTEVTDNGSANPENAIPAGE